MYQGTWGVIWVELWRPLAVLTWGRCSHNTAIVHAGQCHRSMQWLSAESWADMPWERTHLASRDSPKGLGCGLGGAATATASPLRSMQWFLSQQERPSSAQSTPQPGARSGADESWEKPAQPRSQAEVQPPQFLQTQHPYSQPQPTSYHSSVLDLR